VSRQRDLVGWVVLVEVKGDHTITSCCWGLCCCRSESCPRRRWLLLRIRSRTCDELRQVPQDQMKIMTPATTTTHCLQCLPLPLPRLRRQHKKTDAVFFFSPPPPQPLPASIPASPSKVHPTQKKSKVEGGSERETRMEWWGSPFGQTSARPYESELAGAPRNASHLRKWLRTPPSLPHPVFCPCHVTR
jgi:hypothetical protein